MEADKYKPCLEKRMKLASPPGTKDYLPEEQILRNELFDMLKRTFERYGFNPLETPVLEFIETLTSKYAGGAEIVKQIFSLKDRAGRMLGLKYDQTVPMCRVLATNPQLARPFKRYQMDRAWREEFGTRYREFWQCDVDTVGVKSMAADAEFLAIYQDVFDQLNIPIIIKVNNRKLLNDILKRAGIPENQLTGAILSIDKFEKIGETGVIKDAKERGIGEVQIKKALKLLNLKGSNDAKIAALSKAIKSEGLTEIKELLKYAKLLKIKNVEFTPSLARGLEYYTGTVYEVFWKERPDKLSLAGGGRYDNMIGAFLGSKEQVPAVGTTIGLSRIYDILVQKKAKRKSTLVKAFVIPINQNAVAMRIADELRKGGVNTDLDLIGRSPGKNLDYANKLGIPYVVFVGEQEVKAKKYKLRDMISGKEEMLTVRQIVSELK